MRKTTLLITAFALCLPVAAMAQAEPESFLNEPGEMVPPGESPEMAVPEEENAPAPDAEAPGVATPPVAGEAADATATETAEGATEETTAVPVEDDLPVEEVDITTLEGGEGSPPVEETAISAEEEPAPTGLAGLTYRGGGMFDVGMLVGVKLGGGFSQPFSDLGSSFVSELELGYVIPKLDRALAVTLSGQYSAPTAIATIDGDARLTDESFRYNVKLHQFIITLGAQYRIPVGLEVAGFGLVPYAHAGARAYLTRTDIRGHAAGAGFGENEETSTDYGFLLGGGAELFAGPGAAFAELQLGFASVDNYVLQDTNAGAMNLAVGYRMFL